VDHDADLARVAIDLHLDEVVAATDAAELGDHAGVSALDFGEIDVVGHADVLALAQVGADPEGLGPEAQDFVALATRELRHQVRPVMALAGRDATLDFGHPAAALELALDRRREGVRLHLHAPDLREHVVVGGDLLNCVLERHRICAGPTFVSRSHECVTPNRPIGRRRARPAVLVVDARSMARIVLRKSCKRAVDDFHRPNKRRRSCSGL
jgi:hypothetical protein